MAPALVAGAIVAALYGGAFTLLALRSEPPLISEPGRAFSLNTALILGMTMAIMLLAAAALNQWLGETGIAVGAALAGVVDTSSAAISVASLANSANLAPGNAVAPILCAMTTNSLSKIVMAIGAGSSGFALRIVPGIALSMARRGPLP